MGAGSYAMNGAGGAAATGNGDVMMRFLPSYVFLNNFIRLYLLFDWLNLKLIYLVLHELPTSQLNTIEERNNYRS